MLFIDGCFSLLWFINMTEIQNEANLYLLDSSIQKQPVTEKIYWAIDRILSTLEVYKVSGNSGPIPPITKLPWEAVHKQSFMNLQRP